MTRTYRLAVLMVLAGAAGCSSSDPPAPPENPSYQTHVRPILITHCVRCHGQGDMLNGETVDGEVINVASQGYFDHFENRGPCDPDGGPLTTDCKLGAHAYTMGGRLATIQAYLHPPSDLYLRMPPPPAMPLSANELLIVDRWLANPLP
jgi:hypothetical protein